MTRSRTIDLAALAAAFAVGTLAAEAAGAVDLGTSLTFGTIAFFLVLVGVLLRRD